LRPRSVYALSKAQAEEYARAFNAPGLETVRLRYFNVFGPGQKADGPFAPVTARFIKNIKSGAPLTIYGGGAQTRDFLFVADAAAANIHALTKLKAGEVYNAGSGKKTQVKQLLRLIEKATGKKAAVEFKPARKGDIKHSLADIGKIKKTGFKPKYSLAKGLSETIKYF
jgi:UDP-glucose 4-epimerase